MVSPKSTRAVRTNAEVIEAFEGRFELDFYTWPFIVGGPPADPTWQGMAAALREAFSPGSHVYSPGFAAPLTLMALDRYEGVRSVVCHGIAMPPATLLAAGEKALADAVTLTYRAPKGSGTREISRLLQPEASDEHNIAISALIDSDINWPLYEATEKSYETLNLLAEQPRLNMPVLYVEPQPIGLPGFDDMTELFLRIVPDARILRQGGQSAADVAAEVVRFMEEAEN
jgi:hypothetical protein